MAMLPKTAVLDSWHRPRVLIIDDDPQIRSLLTTFLRGDYIVAVSHNGRDGFYKALEHPPDIILIDIQMPEWDGLMTLNMIRKTDEFRQTLAIILTADSSRQTVMEAISLGADDYIVKSSLSRQSLLAKLSSHLVTPQPRAYRQQSAKPGNAMMSSSAFNDVQSQPVLPDIPTEIGHSKSAVPSAESAREPKGCEFPAEIREPKYIQASPDSHLQEVLDAWD